MHDWFFRQGSGKRLIDWLGVDAWIDSSIAQTWETLADRWNSVTTFFARFRLTGWKKLMNEAVSEGLTLGAGGLFVVYALAIPALTEFDENKIATGKYSVKFLDRDGAEIGQRGMHHNDAVPLEDLPDHLIKAALATEDRRFFEHFGVDFLGTARALIENARANEVVQGGSTLTQQLAKNLFLSAERSIQRKVKEAYLAFLLESRFTKREILKLYLDRAYMGGGAFGVEAASQFYFGHSARELTLAESALLAGLFKAPGKYAPHINLPAARARTNEVLSNMVEAGYMSAGQVHAARLNPAKIIDDAARLQPRLVPRLGVRGDPARRRRTRLLRADRPHHHRCRHAAVGPGRHDDHLASDGDAARQSHHRRHGGHGAGRRGARHGRRPRLRREPVQSRLARASPAGLLLQALRVRHGLRARLRPEIDGARLWRRAAATGRPRTTAAAAARAHMTATDAFKVSLNVPAVDLSLRVGREKVLEMTQRLGVEGVKKTCSMALGDTGITPLQHTAAYATFANGGKLSKPYAILEIFNSKGDLIYTRERDEAEAPQVVSRKVAEGMNQMMQAVVLEGTAKRAQLDFTYSAGKTGTSSSYRDAWFIGFTGAMVTGVWVGHDDFRPMHYNGGVTGGSLPAHGLAQLHVGRPHQPQHSGHSRPAAASHAGGRAAAPRRAQAHRPGPGAGADRPDARRRRPASCRIRPGTC